MLAGMTESATAAAAAETPYAHLGGESAVRALVDRFYDLMELEPRFAELRAVHPSTLEGSRDKLFWFLSGWLGGPDLYISRFGHPRLRGRQRGGVSGRTHARAEARRQGRRR